MYKCTHYAICFLSVWGYSLSVRLKITVFFSPDKIFCVAKKKKKSNCLNCTRKF